MRMRQMVKLIFRTSFLGSTAITHSSDFSESECKRAARGVGRMVQKIMGKLADVVRIRNYRVCNVLATCKMPFGIKVEELAQKYPECSQYEPELSVGLVWRSTSPRATLRIHTTGSITVTGGNFISLEITKKPLVII
ncbi:unnamed protein product [Gongylonema pulchrum]|uniref:TBP-like factor n=1 Tax=Gongylonema pulchrum TaxID=637853 RepID=A0A183E846_9BILA|nr:unnamed protein product [Gongylonema pulchrum]